MAGELQIRKCSAQINRNEMLFLYISTIWAKTQLKHFDKICTKKAHTSLKNEHVLPCLLLINHNILNLLTSTILHK